MLSKNETIKLAQILFFILLFAFANGCNSKNTTVKTTIRPEHNLPVIKEHAPEINTKKLDIKASIIDTAQQNDRSNFGYRNGDSFLQRYSCNEKVKQIILVEQSNDITSYGTLFLIVKSKTGDWQELLRCRAYLGKNGIDKKQEGDARTPTGDFGMVMAFGAKGNPGSLIPYTKLTNTMYLCGDKEYYNQFIDVSKVNHICSNNSEHLINYLPQYNYALIFDYNKENVYGKGSAIFLHCFGSNPFTLGCIAIAEENMVKILNTIDANARICIYSSK